MAYRVLASVVVVKGRDGRLRHHYSTPTRAAGGPIIPWLNPEQRAHFLRHKLVEELADDDPASVPAPPAPPDAQWPPIDDDDECTAPAVDGTCVPDDLVAECIKALDELRDADGPLVPSSAGAPTCRKALREQAKVAFSNEVIAAAVRYRKMRAA
jgi:hypothetical protein